MVLGGLWIFKTCEMPFTLVVSITLYSSCSAGGILPSKGLFCFAFPAACCIFCLLHYDLVSYHFLGVHIRRVMSGTGITALCALALMIERGQLMLDGARRWHLIKKAGVCIIRSGQAWDGVGRGLHQYEEPAFLVHTHLSCL